MEMWNVAVAILIYPSPVPSPVPFPTLSLSLSLLLLLLLLFCFLAPKCGHGFSCIDEAAADRQTVRHITYTCAFIDGKRDARRGLTMVLGLPSQMGFWPWVCALFVYNVLLDLCLANALYKYVCRQLSSSHRS